MNRKQRRARHKQIKKSKEAPNDIEQKLGLFDLIPEECFVCQKPFNKLDKEMVNTWNVVVREQEKSVKVYCPTCWNKAKNILKQFGAIPNEGQDK